MTAPAHPGQHSDSRATTLRNQADTGETLTPDQEAALATLMQAREAKVAAEQAAEQAQTDLYTALLAAQAARVTQHTIAAAFGVSQARISQLSIRAKEALQTDTDTNTTNE